MIEELKIEEITDYIKKCKSREFVLELYVGHNIDKKITVNPYNDTLKVYNNHELVFTGSGLNKVIALEIYNNIKPTKD